MIEEAPKTGGGIGDVRAAQSPPIDAQDVVNVVDGRERADLLNNGQSMPSPLPCALSTRSP